MQFEWEIRHCMSYNELRSSVENVMHKVSQSDYGQIRSHLKLSQKSEGHHRSYNHFTTPIVALYTIQANDFGAKWSN